MEMKLTMAKRGRLTSASVCASLLLALAPWVGSCSETYDGEVTPQAPPEGAPGGLTAFAGNEEATLVWGVSRFATSYFVKRSTTPGGPHDRVGMAIGTNFKDTKLTAGTTYYYVVSAHNSAGETRDSGEVSVTPLAAP
jgi:hypothetical protein